jgi:hypothetical protein
MARKNGLSRPYVAKKSKKDYQTAGRPKKCGLLELPAELRNRIWELLVPDEKAYILKDSTLTCSSPLRMANHQIRREISDMCFLLSPRVWFEVVDLDFSHVACFLNKLTDSEIQDFTSIKRGGRGLRTVHIKLIITDSCECVSSLLKCVPVVVILLTAFLDIQY